MATFILVHGAWHGPWSWNKVTPLLQKHGHRVEAVDLTKLGSLDAYVDTTARAVELCSEPVVLVGHSSGGVTISQVAELMPQRIHRLVYLTAYLLKSGQCLFDVAGQDGDSKLAPVLVVSEETGLVSVPEKHIRESFYNDCSDGDVEWAKALLGPQPIAPFVTKIEVGRNYESVGRVYIECVRDNAISIQAQRRMLVEQPCSQVVSMKTGHSPFLSAPIELTNHLVSVAGA